MKRLFFFIAVAAALVAGRYATGQGVYYAGGTVLPDQCDLTNSIVSWWKLEEASGNRVDTPGTVDITSDPGPGQAAAKVNNGADFESGSSHFLESSSDPSALDFADADFTIAGWVNLESVGALRSILTKWNETGDQRQYRLIYDHTGTTFKFQVSSDGTAIASVSSSITPSTATWYFLVAWHDATANTINITVNNGSPNSTSHSGGCFNSTADVMMGAGDGAVDFFDGLIDEVGVWSRVLTAGERTVLYNNGTGITYPTCGASSPTFFAVQTNNITDQSPVVLFPAGTQENDIALIYFVTVTTHTSAGTPPTGATKIVEVDGGSESGSAFWMRAPTGGFVTTNFTTIFTTTEAGKTVVVVYRGCITTGSPVDDFETNVTASATAHDLPELTTTVVNTIVVGCFGSDPEDGTASTFTWDGGITERIDSNTNPDGDDASNASIHIGDKAQATAGAVNMGGDFSATETSVGIVIALKPPP
jgi:hypothetical protein